MNLNRFICRTVIRSAVVVAIVYLLSFAEPLVANNIALGQMQNSDEAFMLMSAYNNFKSFSGIVKLITALWYTGAVIRDVHIFNKSNKEN